MSVRSQRNMRDRVGIDARGEPAFIRPLERSRVTATRQFFAARLFKSFPDITTVAQDEHFFTRASTATFRTQGGLPVTVPNNRERYHLGGETPDRTLVSIDQTARNYLLNSETPVTQTTESLSVGLHTYWQEGNTPTTGTGTVAAGTAVITGGGTLTGNGTLVFNVATAGTVTVTVGTGLRRFQLERDIRTSYIPTTTATVARAAERLRWVPRPSLTGSGLFQRQGTMVLAFRFPVLDIQFTQVVAELNNGTGAQRIQIVRGSSPTGNLNIRVWNGTDNGAGLSVTGPGAVLLAATHYRCAFSWSTTTTRFCMTGSGIAINAALPSPTGITQLEYGTDSGGGGAGTVDVGVVARFDRVLSDVEMLDMVANP